MLTYDVKTYERFFWMLYKDAFKPAVKNLFIFLVKGVDLCPTNSKSKFMNPVSSIL